ncbi:Pycsar system effector family protein [Clostridium sp.]|uniref:Pycsar system effector family protein n=1 Tax=Clostridium sp. TaxID=1506 RepID=UPI003993384C
MNDNQIREHLNLNINRFDNYIEKADNKANFLLALSTVLIGSTLFSFDNILKLTNHNVLKIFLTIALIFINITLTISIVYSLRTLFPRTPKSTSSNKSLFYFEDVKKLTKQSFLQKLKNINDELSLEDFCEQNIQLATICSEKMDNIKQASNCLKYSIYAIIILFILMISTIYLK